MASYVTLPYSIVWYRRVSSGTNRLPNSAKQACGPLERLRGKLGRASTASLAQPDGPGRKRYSVDWRDQADYRVWARGTKLVDIG
eukprot:16427897-Heterocapsa_arctica.AAC.1